MKSWINDVNAIRKETAALYNYYTDLKPGCSDVPPFWQKAVPVEVLVEGKTILQKTGNTKENMVGPLRQNAIDYERYFNYLHYTF